MKRIAGALDLVCADGRSFPTGLTAAIFRLTLNAWHRHIKLAKPRSDKTCVSHGHRHAADCDLNRIRQHGWRGKSALQSTDVANGDAAGLAQIGGNQTQTGVLVTIQQ
jgi:hypothetical protein